MSKIEDLKHEYDVHLREGREEDATKTLQEIRSLRSPQKEVSSSDVDFTSISGVGDELAGELREEYSSFDELAEASPEDLEPIPGVGEKRALSIIEQAGE